MNTRRYPRTTLEAFPNTPEYGAAIERPAHHGDRAVTIALIGAAIYLVVLALVEWLA